MAEKKTRQANREGKVPVTFWTQPEVRDDLKVLAIELDKTVEELLGDAVADLFRKHAKSRRYQRKD